MPDTGLLWANADTVGRAVGLLLLAMSVASWVLIGWKTLLLRRAARSLTQGLALCWQAPDWSTARAQVGAVDAEALLLPLMDAAEAPLAGLGAQLEREAARTRVLRDALHRVLARLQRGQVVLASIGATAPFVGLLGTVWGIYQALLGLGGGAAFTLDRIAGPVGEALVMTAAGLAVALPAVLAYNLMGRRIARLEADLEGFAHDLRELLAPAGHAP